MEYNLTLKDILKILVSSWKALLAIMVIGAVLGAVVPILTSDDSGDIPAEELAENEVLVKTYDDWISMKGEMTEQVSHDLVAAYDYAQSSAYMKLNAYDCTFNQIVIEFGDSDAAVRTGLVEGWISDGYTDANTGAPTYLTDVKGTAGEVIITVWDTGEYDLDQASSEIKDYVVARAAENQMPVLAAENFSRKGFSEDLFEKQDVLRSYMIRIQNEMVNYNATTAIPAPSRLTGNDDKGNGAQRGIALGGLAGLFLGIVLVVFNVVRKGTIVAKAQIAESFGWAELGKYSGKSESDAKLLKATIEAAAKDKKRIILFNDADKSICEELVESLNSDSTCEYYSGSGLSEDVVNAELITGMDAVVVPLRLGKTTFKDVYRCSEWARRFCKEVVGYIVLDA